MEEIPNIEITKQRKYLYLSLFFICVSIVLYCLVREGVLDVIDYSVIYYVVTHLRREWLNGVVKGITLLGSYAVIVLIITYSFFFKDKRVALSFALAMIIATLCNLLIKYMVRRPRPDGIALVYEEGYSFPSGHSMMSLVMLAMVIYNVVKFVKSKKIKAVTISFSAILTILIGLSRIYLGVHYVSDVLSAWTIGLAVAFACIFAMEYLLKFVIYVYKKVFRTDDL